MEKYATNKTNVVKSETILLGKKKINFTKFFLMFFVVTSFVNFCWAYHVEPSPVHQWIALEAYLKIASGPGDYADLVSEMQSYLPTEPSSSYYTLGFSHPNEWDNDPDAHFETSTALIEGVWEEDHGVRWLHHFWDPTSSYDDGLYENDSALERAQLYFEVAKLHYNDDYPNNLHLAYYKLGRAAHLLMDMSVPAHTLLDPHLDPDQYETFTGVSYKDVDSSSVNTDIPSSGQLTEYNHFTLAWYDETLTKLFYTLAEISNDFDSDDKDGNSVDDGGGKYRSAKNTLNSSKVFLRAEYWGSSSKIRDMIQGQDYDIFTGCSGVSEYSIYYYRSFYDEINGTVNSVKVFYTDSSDETFPSAFLERLQQNIPDSILECIHQPELQTRAIGYVAALYQLFWDETHPDTLASLSSPGVQPSSGDTNTNFQFSVTFTDPENDPPDTNSVKLVLDSTEYIMTTTDTDYTDGSVFVSESIQLSQGSHQYYFEAAQGGVPVQGSPTGTQTLNVDLPSAGEVTVGLSPNPVEVFQSTTVTVTVRDSSNNPLPGVTVDFSQNGFPGIMNPTSDTTDGSGQATSTFTPNASGSALISAQVSGGGPSDGEWLTVNPGTITFELSFSPAGGNAYDFQAKLLNNGSPWQGESVTLTLSPGSLAYFNRTGTSTFSTTTNGAGYAQDGGSSVVDVTTTDYGLLTVSAEHDGTGVISTITTNISDGSGTTFEVYKNLGYAGIDVDWSGNGNLVAIKDSGSNTYLIENILTTPTLWNSVSADCSSGRGVVFSPTSSQMLAVGSGNNYEMAVITLNYPSGTPSIVASGNKNGRVEDRAIDWGNSIASGHTNYDELRVYNTSLGLVCGINIDDDDVTAVAFDQTNLSRFVYGDWGSNIKAGTTSCSVLWSKNVSPGQITSAAWRGNNVVVGDNTGIIHRYNASGGSQSNLTHGSSSVTATEFSPDGLWLATCGGGGIKIWSTSSWSVAYTGPSATSVAWDPTSTYLVDNNGKLYAPFNQIPPTIIISSPPDGYETYAATVDVTGTITGPLGISSATITVNAGAPETLTLDPSDNFTHPVSLSLGANTIRIDASGGGKSNYSEITVTRLTDVDGPVISSVTVLPSTEEIGTIFNISASVIDAFSSVNAASVTCHIQLPDEADVATLQMYDDGTNGDVTPSDSVYTCEWNSSGATEDSYLIDITASDVPGNPSEAENVRTLVVYDLPSFGAPTVDPPSPTDTNDVTITINITDPAGISSKTLWYQHLSNPGWIPVAMTGSGPSYNGTIPMMDEGTVQYKAEATDGLGYTGESTVYSYGITDATPPVVWDWSRTPLDITENTTGVVAVSVKAIDVGGSGLNGTPQMDYRLSDGTFDGWEAMTAAGSDVYTFDIPDLGWNVSGGKSLEYKVRAVDMQANELITNVQTELIDFTYILSVTIQGQGNVTLDPNNGIYSSGTSVQLTADPNAGWHFDRWEGDLLGDSNNPTTILIDSNKNVTVVFELNPPCNVLVPDVNGMTEANAEAALIAEGLTKGSVSSQCSDTVPAGQVMDQDPNSGVSVLCGSAVDLEVSTGQGQTWYYDGDSDGYGDLSVPTQSCSQPPGYVLDNTDCNDSDGLINPSATEVCDGVDNNCDGQIDEGVGQTWYYDGDSDGYGDSSIPTQSCSQPPGYVLDNTDCNDSDGLINPSATEVCDGVDNNCDGQIDEGLASVPDVNGMTEANAEAALIVAGLVKGNVTYQYDNTEPAGQVMDQDPDSGTSVACGSAVDLVIFDGSSVHLSPDLDNSGFVDFNDYAIFASHFKETDCNQPASEWILLDGELNNPRNGLTGEALNGYLYAMGGGYPGGGSPYAQNTVSRYNPANDTWYLESSMPTLRHSLSSAVIDGWIYAVGGHVANSRSENERYNGTSWESRASVYARSSPGVAAYDGELYVFGGNRFATILSRVDIYDPDTDTWRSGCEMPAATQPGRAVTLGDIIYVNNGDDPNELWAYDPVGCTWDTSLPLMNVSRGSYELQAVNGRIYAIGGNGGSGAISSVESWAPGEASWRMEPSLNVARYGFASAVIGYDIYVFGGYNGGDLGSTEVLHVGWCEGTDLDRSGSVDISDSWFLFEHWLGVVVSEPPEPEIFYELTLDTNPGWTTEGLWAFGQPTGGGGAYGGPDPTAGYTGANVYGYNLAGDYENNLSETHLTSTAIDCSGKFDVHLKFWRWLGVETPTYDHAYVRISNNGTDWTTVWQNTGEVTDASWVQVNIDISSVADDQSAVYLRWTIGNTDSSWTYCGWNIDDIELWRTP